VTRHAIPEAALKRHIAILGMNGSGKTSVAKSEIIEPALAAGERVCNIDPTGVGWGLRLSATGKSKGHSIYIVGGAHADFPLFRRDGKAWGEIVGTSSDSFVFDTSQMTVSDRSVWFTEFAETLLRLNKGPLKLVIDEAHLFAPQGGAKGGGATPDMLHATNNLLALGRSRGLRITMISQRPAKLHKDSLTQAHTLVAMSLMAPHDRNAVSEWIADQADTEKGKEIVASLPTLEPGEGWIWAPREKVLERVRFARPKTFDSSSAPDDADGDGPELPPINPGAIKAKLETVAKETVANDPAKLRAELAKVKGELAKAVDFNVNKAPVIDEAALKFEYERGYIKGCEHMTGLMSGRHGDAISRLHHLESELNALARALEEPVPKFQRVDIPHTQRAVPPKAAAPLRMSSPAPLPQRRGNGHDTGEVGSGGLRRILTALAQRQDGLTNRQIGVRAGLSSKSGTFSTYISKGRSNGWIADRGDRRVITEAGLAALGDYEPLPAGRDLLDHWLRELGESGAARLLKAVADAYPAGLTNAEAGERANLSHGSGTFSTYLSKLRTLELVTGRGELRASDELFE
jgi:hypothetical protein